MSHILFHLIHFYFCRVFSRSTKASIYWFIDQSINNERRFSLHRRVNRSFLLSKFIFISCLILNSFIRSITLKLFSIKSTTNNFRKTKSFFVDASHIQSFIVTLRHLDGLYFAVISSAEIRLFYVLFLTVNGHIPWSYRENTNSCFDWPAFVKSKDLNKTFSR